MKALTLWQPWAALIALGVKQYETRHWTAYRGKLAIHAAKRPIHAEDLSPTILRALNEYGLRSDKLPLGAVVCIVDVLQVRQTVAVLADLTWDGHWADELHFGNYSPGRYAWQLGNVRVLEPPIPARGARGLWTWHAPEGVIE